MRNKKVSFEDVKQRLNILENTKELLENAIMLNTELINDEDNPNRILMHVFYCVTDYNGKKVIVKIKVDEFKDDNNPVKRFYNLNDIEIPSVGIGGSAPLADTDGITSGKPDKYTISDLFKLVKTFDKSFNPVKSSVVVDDYGIPKKMYRGENGEYTERGQSGSDAFYLNIKNPYKGDIDALDLEYGSREATFSYLKSQNYDGIDLYGDGSVYIPFDENQVKSAGNQGTFRLWDNNVMHSRMRTDAGVSDTRVSGDDVLSGLQKERKITRREIKALDTVAYEFGTNIT